jgi:hypothetical protein
MKTNWILSVLAVSIAGCLVSPVNTLAGSADEDDLVPYQAALRSTSNLELPAKAAALVQAARPEKRPTTGIGVVRVVAKMNPAALPPVVGAIAKVEPRIGPVVAGEAARLEPKLATQIEKAAVGEITLAASKPIAASGAVEGMTVTEKNSGKGSGRPDPVPGPPYMRGHYKSAWWPPPNNPHSGNP